MHLLKMLSKLSNRSKAFMAQFTGRPCISPRWMIRMVQQMCSIQQQNRDLSPNNALMCFGTRIAKGTLWAWSIQFRELQTLLRYQFPAFWMGLSIVQMKLLRPGKMKSTKNASGLQKLTGFEICLKPIKFSSSHQGQQAPTKVLLLQEGQLTLSENARS